MESPGDYYAVLLNDPELLAATIRAEERERRQRAASGRPGSVGWSRLARIQLAGALRALAGRVDGLGVVDEPIPTAAR